VRAIRHLVLFVLYAAVGIVLAGVTAFILFGLQGKPDLSPWHTAPLREEFTREASGRIKTLADYRRLEDRLFEELQHEVYEQPAESAARGMLSRYTAGSRADPASLPENFNRTFELDAESPRAGVLLIHGLTDSPYVYRTLADHLHKLGCSVVALRLPGHGTAPSALTRIDWRDWAAAVRMAATDLRNRLPSGAPLYMVGFSTGAALAVEYSLARLEGEELPAADALVLLSPAIGVDPMAWLDLLPEYDPYKYNSFPVRAGREIYTLTQVIDQRLTRLSSKGPVRGFPRTLIFQSVVDATVSPQAVVQIFLGRLASEGHELVVYDLNRRADAEPLLRAGARRSGEQLLNSVDLPFDMTLITNETDATAELAAVHRPAHGPIEPPVPIGISWPAGMFSLSHTALPISPDDPIYGSERPSSSSTVYLGRLELLGEQGVLAVPANALVRLRFNPFFSYQENRIEHFLALSAAVN